LLSHFPDRAIEEIGRGDIIFASGRRAAAAGIGRWDRQPGLPRPNHGLFVVLECPGDVQDRFNNLSPAKPHTL
jgi:hypothetical protein